MCPSRQILHTKFQTRSRAACTLKAIVASWLMVLACACTDDMASATLYGTGVYSGISSYTKTGIMDRSCNVWNFYVSSLNDTIIIELSGPFYPGRTYEHTTLPGTITIDDVWYTVDSVSDIFHIRLLFDIAASEQDTFKGEATFTHRILEYRPCTWPERVPGPPVLTQDGPGSVGPSYEEDVRTKYPPTYMGTEDNLIIVPRDLSLTPVGNITVYPSRQDGGNFFCPLEPSKDPLRIKDFTCVGRPNGPFIYNYPMFRDTYGIFPTLAMEFPPEFNLSILKPVKNEELYSDNPLVIRWSNPRGPSHTVSVRLYREYGNSGTITAYSNDEVPDTGEFTLDISKIAHVGYGTATLKVFRFVRSETFPFPVREGSYADLVSSDEVLFSIKFTKSVTFPAPEEHVPGWTEPLVLDDASDDAPGCAIASPVLASDSYNLVAAWVWSWGGEQKQVRISFWNPAEGKWEPIIESPYAGNLTGKLGLSVAGDMVLAWGVRYKTDPPVVAVIAKKNGEVTVREILGTGPVVENREVGGLLRPDGTWVIALSNAQDQLLASVNGDPCITLMKDMIGGAPIYPRSDGYVAIPTHADLGGLLIWDPLFPAPPWHIPINNNDPMDSCTPKGALLPNDRVISLFCGGRGKTAIYSLITGDLGPQETITNSANILESLVSWDLKVGPDGVPWFLFATKCDYGWCPVLFRRDEASGAWEGPLIPGHAHGEMHFAVDPANKVHIIYMPSYSNESLKQGETLHHTMME